jgi:Ser/Thr protein kinase RdoA (MazF antagonist)
MDHRLILQQASDFFELSEIKSVRKAEGDANANYFVNTEKGNFLFKIILEPHPTKDKQAEAVYVDLLRKNGLPVVPCLHHDGNAVYEHDGVRVMVQKALLNNEYSDKASAIEQIAENLAKMHLVSFGGLPDRVSWLKADSLKKQIEILKEKFHDQEGVRRIVDCYDSLNNFIKEILPVLPKSIIHGDLHLGNVLFDDNRLIAIIDWEEACIHASLLDFALSVTDCCYEDSDFDEEMFRKFFKAYNTVRLLSKEELQALPDAMKYVAVVQAAWRYLTHNYLRPDEKKKDYYNALWGSGFDVWEMPRI